VQYRMHYLGPGDSDGYHVFEVACDELAMKEVDSKMSEWNKQHSRHTYTFHNLVRIDVQEKTTLLTTRQQVEEWPGWTQNRCTEDISAGSTLVD
jgi:hypothetical protein